jgi:L-rhamnose isomerase
VFSHWVGYLCNIDNKNIGTFTLKKIILRCLLAPKKNLKKLKMHHRTRNDILLFNFVKKKHQKRIDRVL